MTTSENEDSGNNSILIPIGLGILYLLSRKSKTIIPTIEPEPTEQNIPYNAISDIGGTMSKFTHYMDVNLFHMGILTAFQKKLTIRWQEGMQNGFGDIRANIWNGTTWEYVPYWLQSKTDSDTADILIKNDYMDVSTIVRIYYGNAELNDESDPVDVFDDWYDFEDGTSQGWNLLDGSSVQTTIVKDGTYSLRIEDNSGMVGHGGGITKTDLSLDNQIIEWDFYFAADADIYQSIVNFNDVSSNAIVNLRPVGLNSYEYGYWDTSAKSFSLGAQIRPQSIWFKESYAVFDEFPYLKAWHNDVYLGTGGLYSDATYAPITGMVIGSGSSAGTGTIGYIDNIRIRKYTAIEPTYIIGPPQHYRGIP